MIDFNLRAFIHAMGAAERLWVHGHAAENPDAFPSEGAVKQIREELAIIAEVIIPLGMVRTKERLEWTDGNFAAGVLTTFGGLANEAFELQQAIRKDAEEQFFYHYPNERIGFLLKLKENWNAVFSAFPSSRSEIEFGVDAYAFGNNAACVFHMCRVGEIGLRAIAKERGVKTVRGNIPVQWGTWGQVFQTIEPIIEDMNKNKPNGPRKDAALAFYKTVLSDLRTLQSFRDQTMHFRERYDDGEAQSAMFRARELMAMLASRLNEATPIRAIPWSAWAVK